MSEANSAANASITASPAVFIRDGVVADNPWQWLGASAKPEEQINLPLTGNGPWLVPFALWQARRDEVIERAIAHQQPLGVWLEGHEDPAKLEADLPHLALIAIRFPRFTDGRGYSTAYLLRKRLGFAGELRAVGDILRDQLFALQRVGFNSFELHSGLPVAELLAAFKDFTTPYQGSVDQPQPLFRRFARELGTPRAEAAE